MERNSAAEIVDFVVSNGRVLQDENGDLNPASLAVEVEFEACERGLTNSEEIAAEAVRLQFGAGPFK